MFKGKKNLVIAIMTRDMDALRVSVPPLRGFSRKATLIIYNDNTDIKLQKSEIKKLGWGGDVHIINTEVPHGEISGRVEMMEYIVKHCANAEWTVFVNDTDVLIDADIPNVSENTFAIVQNATTLAGNLIDIFKISHSWATGTEYGQTAPRFDITGPMLRTVFLGEFAAFIKPLLSQIEKNTPTSHSAVPFGVVMWTALGAFMHAQYPYTAPIYMNRTNYVAIKIGLRSGTTNAKTLQKYIQFFEAAAKENTVASAQ